jgi:hypothetical protein
VAGPRGDAETGFVLSLLAILGGVTVFAILGLVCDLFSSPSWGVKTPSEAACAVLLGLLLGGMAFLALLGSINLSRNRRALARLPGLVAAEPTIGVLTVEDRGSSGWHILLAGQAVGRRCAVGLAWGHAPEWLRREQAAEVRVRSLGRGRSPVLIESNMGDLALVFPSWGP